MDFVILDVAGPIGNSICLDFDNPFLLEEKFVKSTKELALHTILWYSKTHVIFITDVFIFLFTRNGLPLLFNSAGIKKLRPVTGQHYLLCVG